MQKFNYLKEVGELKKLNKAKLTARKAYRENTDKGQADTLLNECSRATLHHGMIQNRIRYYTS